MTPPIGISSEGLAYAQRYAEHLIHYIGPCPWNSFPRDSLWGRALDEQYHQDETRRRYLQRKHQ